MPTFPLHPHGIHGDVLQLVPDVPHRLGPLEPSRGDLRGLRRPKAGHGCSQTGRWSRPRGRSLPAMSLPCQRARRASGPGVEEVGDGGRGGGAVEPTDGADFFVGKGGGGILLDTICVVPTRKRREPVSFDFVNI